MILGLLFIIFVIGFFAAAFTSDDSWSIWVGIVCGVVAIVCLIIGCLQEEAKPMEITTKQPPQIDTTITYSKGVADTVYTYHIIKKQ